MPWGRTKELPTHKEAETNLEGRRRGDLLNNLTDFAVWDRQREGKILKNIQMMGKKNLFSEQREKVVQDEAGECVEPTSCQKPEAAVEVHCCFSPRKNLLGL